MVLSRHPRPTPLHQGGKPRESIGLHLAHKPPRTQQFMTTTLGLFILVCIGVFSSMPQRLPSLMMLATKSSPADHYTLLDPLDDDTFHNHVDLFRSYLSAHQDQLTNTWNAHFLDQKQSKRGIVISAGLPDALANVFVNTYVLRTLHKCTLPIVVAYYGDSRFNDTPTAGTIQFIKDRIENLQFLDLNSIPYPSHHRELQRPGHFIGWKVKVYSLYAAPFQQVLYLDSDNLPLVDPEYLFEDDQYKQHGNLFWPDIWCGSSGIHEKLGMPSDAASQTESGQFLFDRQRHYLVLEWLLWLNTRDEYVYEYSYGDKDTFKAAFYLADRLDEFQSVTHRLGLLLDFEASQKDYVLRGFGQFAMNGSLLFAHRVGPNKYSLLEQQTVNKTTTKSSSRNVRYISLVSCSYFTENAYNDTVLLLNHTMLPALQLDQPPAACSGAGRLHTPSIYSMHEAVDQCLNYNTKTANASDLLPVVSIPLDSYVARALNASEEAFELLLALVKKKDKDSSIFTLSLGTS